MNKHIELAKKLKALADRGIGGEKSNAEQKLKSLMKKRRITIEDIEGEELFDHVIKVTEDKRKLFHQIGFSVVGKGYRNLDVRRYRNKMYIRCTKAHAIEMESKLNFYWKLYQEELDIFYNAFVQRNKIFSSDDTGKKEDKEETPEEKEKIRRIIEMSTTIKRSSFNKQIEK